MANIDRELNQIKTAIYGKDVRGSIHDGIDKINKETEVATGKADGAKNQVNNIQQQVDNLVVSGDSSVEAAQARVDKNNRNYTSLKQRLDTEQEQVTSQLAEKAQQTEVNKLEISKADRAFVNTELNKKAGYVDVRLKTEKISLNDADAEMLAAIEGGEGTDFNILSVPRNRSVSPRKTDFVATGKNFFNKNVRNISKGVNAAGLYDSEIYDTTDFIPVFAAVPINVSRSRNYVLYDLEENYLTYTNNTDYVDQVVTPAQDGYLRATLFKTDIDTVQIEIGTSQSIYEPYHVTIPSLDISKNIPEMLKQDLTLIKTGNLVNIRSEFDSINDIVVSTDVRTTSNRLFNFNNTYLIPKDTIDYQVDSLLIPANRIHATLDDITPIRTWYTVGANHGYAAFELTGISGKVVADIGSQWTDGTRTYTLLNVIGTTLVFGFPYTEVDGIVSVDTTLPIADLTHVSGATNTSNINVTAGSPAQFFPSVNDISRKYLLDGEPLANDGIFRGDKLQIIEKYNIVDYKSIIDYAKANIGSYVGKTINSLSTSARLRISYEFVKGANCTIHHNLYAYKKLNLGNCGFLQSGVMSASGFASHQYLPNVKPKGGYDFKGLVDLTPYNANLVFVPTDYLDPLIPPHRYVTWLMSGGVKKAGFTMGYIPDMADSSNIKRLTNTDGAWDLRSTKKNYPVALNGITVNSGDYFNFIGYRNYLSPTNAGSATNVTTIEVGNETYVYIDYHVSTTFGNINLDKHIGKSITVVEKSADFTIINDVVDADGVIFNVKNGYGYAILKIK